MSTVNENCVTDGKSAERNDYQPSHSYPMKAEYAPKQRRPLPSNRQSSNFISVNGNDTPLEQRRPGPSNLQSSNSNFGNRNNPPEQRRPLPRNRRNSQSDNNNPAEQRRPGPSNRRDNYAPKQPQRKQKPLAYGQFPTNDYKKWQQPLKREDYAEFKPQKARIYQPSSPRKIIPNENWEALKNELKQNRPVTNGKLSKNVHRQSPHNSPVRRQNALQKKQQQSRPIENGKARKNGHLKSASKSPVGGRQNQNGQLDKKHKRHQQQQTFVVASVMMAEQKEMLQPKITVVGVVLSFSTLIDSQEQMVDFFVYHFKQRKFTQIVKILRTKFPETCQPGVWFRLLFPDGFDVIEHFRSVAPRDGEEFPVIVPRKAVSCNRRLTTRIRDEGVMFFVTATYRGYCAADDSFLYKSRLGMLRVTRAQLNDGLDESSNNSSSTASNETSASSATTATTAASTTTSSTTTASSSSDSNGGEQSQQKEAQKRSDKERTQREQQQKPPPPPPGQHQPSSDMDELPQRLKLWVLPSGAGDVSAEGYFRVKRIDARIWISNEPDSDSDGSSVNGDATNGSDNRVALSHTFSTWFDEMVTAFHEANRLSDERRLAIQQFVEELQQGFRTESENDSLKIELFGSVMSGFGSNDCDIDLCLVNTDNTKEQRDHNGIIPPEKRREWLNKLTHYLRKSRFTVISVTDARTPIVKFEHHGERGFHGDISVENVLALHNTELLRLYSCFDARVAPLGFAVKRWAKLYGINDASAGSISSYAYIVMLIHFLQRVDPPVLPFLQNDLKEQKVEGWNVSYIRQLPEQFTKKNTLSIAQLFYDFLAFYAFHFDVHTDVAQIRTAKPYSKGMRKRDLGCGDDQRFRLCVEDPFDLEHNLTSVVREDTLQYIIKCFRSSARGLLRFDEEHFAATKDEEGREQEGDGDSSGNAKKTPTMTFDQLMRPFKPRRVLHLTNHNNNNSTSKPQQQQ